MSTLAKSMINDPITSEKINISGLMGSSKALFVVLLGRFTKKPILFLTSKNDEAEKYANDICCFASLLGTDRSHVTMFPAYEVDCYRLSPHPEISEQRSVALCTLLNSRVDFLVTSVEAALFRTVSPDEMVDHCRTLRRGQECSPEVLVKALVASGYKREDPVTDIGEFSQRGGILDIFSPNHENPLRIEFFGDEIESIRYYDAQSQKSIQALELAEIIPMREFSPSREQLQSWSERALDTWVLDEDNKYLRERVSASSQGETFPCFEFLLPLIQPLQHSIFNYLDDYIVFVDEPELISSKAREITRGLQDRYQEVLEQSLPGLPPEKLILSLEALDAHLRQTRSVECRTLGRLDTLAQPGNRTDGESRNAPDSEPDSARSASLLNEAREDVTHEFVLADLLSLKRAPQREVFIKTKPVRNYHGLIKDLIEDVQGGHGKDETILFLLSSLGRAERLAEILRDYDLPSTLIPADPPPTELLENILSPSQQGHLRAHGIFIAVSPLTSGFYWPESHVRVYATSDLFDEADLKVSRRRKGRRSSFFSDLRDLRQGDYVVHTDHGIGQFQGLTKMTVANEVKEFMLLIYRDGDKVYVPVENLDLIQKYRGVGDAKPALDKLGGVSWARTKAKIKKSMQDMAEELLHLYAKRGIVEGFAFPLDDHWQTEFEEAFEFEETPDQVISVADMKKDMLSPRPMDRLICGDVGYGKTEVAMRGAFKAVTHGKQVAVLTPTTVLAFQHHTTFKNRFQAFPVKIEMLSRFKSKRDQKQILEEIENGTVDIAIGTHRLLSKDVKFRDLGLVIIDEEQRFGVKQKERLKRLKTQVDIISLSATPIPRTLHMALLGLRDMSIIETPPKDRLAIQTVVARFDRNIIKSAIELEMTRKGQVYFIHNRIESIYSVANMIQELCPGARVAVAHGQMRERELERIMLDFVSHKSDVLVSTTIVENGLDIPLVNTILIDRADMYGLSELYQLRGRVGRSNRPAYAYLLVPPEEGLSEVARKRLAAIREFSELGSGFHLAAVDMEIRGAGNLLGGQQHGHINAIGFELYCQLLESTMHKLKGEVTADEIKTTIDLKLDIHIPESYIEDPNQRLRVYKKIASAGSEDELTHIQSEIIDRFGKYPPSVANLFEYAQLRLLARKLFIHSIEKNNDKLFIKFSPQSSVSPERILRIISRDKNSSFSPEGTLTLKPAPSRSEPEQIRILLQNLEPSLQ